MHTRFSLQNDQSGSLLPANVHFSDSSGANWHVTRSRRVLGSAPVLEERGKFVLSKKIKVKV